MLTRLLRRSTYALGALALAGVATGSLGTGPLHALC